MIIKKASGKVIGAHLTAAEKKAMNIEVQKQLSEYTRKHANEIDALFLWYLHEEFGFGIKRLRQVHDGFMPKIEELCNRYEMTEEGDSIWLCTHKLKEYGVDIEEWNKERGD